MRNFIVLMALTLTSVAQANRIDTAFKKETAVPQELQKSILENLKTRCGDIVEAYGLTEIKTTVRIDRVDQGVIDRYYTTTFSSRYSYDYHPRTATITVESVEWSYQYDDPYAILSIKSDSGCN